MALPLYEMTISDEMTSDLEVTAIALVDEPAIQVNWQAFTAQSAQMNFATINEDERLIIGPAMIPDMKIYRNDTEPDGLGEYNVFFSKNTVKKIAEKFYAKGFQGSANIMHDAGQKVEGVNYFLSWIKDDAKGMIGLAGDYPNGTWFVGARVNNPDVWAKIKSGAIKGFSVEGMFQYASTPTVVDASETLLQKIKEILNGIND